MGHSVNAHTLEGESDRGGVNGIVARLWPPGAAGGDRSFRADGSGP